MSSDSKSKDKKKAVDYLNSKKCFAVAITLIIYKENASLQHVQLFKIYIFEFCYKLFYY
jgi:hypothetical protein